MAPRQRSDQLLINTARHSRPWAETTIVVAAQAGVLAIIAAEWLAPAAPPAWLATLALTLQLALLIGVVSVVRRRHGRMHTVVALTTATIGLATLVVTASTSLNRALDYCSYHRRTFWTVTDISRTYNPFTDAITCDLTSDDGAHLNVHVRVWDLIHDAH